MRTTARLKAACLGFLVIGICVLGTGCSPGKARVKGKVKFFDKTLTAGTVTFIAKDGRSGSGNIDFEGNYDVPDAPVGECVIIVKVPAPPKAGPKGMKMPKAPKGMPEMPNETGADEGKILMGNIDPSKIVQIPVKYANPKDSRTHL